MGQVKLVCSFCGTTNFKYKNGVSVKDTSAPSFRRCPDCGTITCFKCIKNMSLNKFSGNKCPKCNGNTVEISSGSDCFITTAVLETLNGNDDCYELTKFREFRDEQLIDKYPELINEYYAIAPIIVKNINNDVNAKSIYKNIWHEYLKPCLNFIESEHYSEAKDGYIYMVRELQKEYLENK